MPDHDYRMTAYHEAAHFVLDYYLCPGCDSVSLTIEPGEDHFGRYVSRGPSSDDVTDEDDRCLMAMVDMAGLAAEKELVRRQHKKYPTDRCSWAGDFIRAQELLREDAVDTPRCLHVLRKTQAVVAKRWEDICAVAQMLLLVKTIDGERAVEILHDSIRQRTTDALYAVAEEVA